MTRFVRRLFIFVASAGVLIAAGTLVPRPLLPAADPAPPERHILVVTNAIHTDIAVPLDADVLARFAPLEASGLPLSHPDARYLVFGWGGRAFYIETPTWSELKPGPLIKALTLDDAVIHASIAGALDEVTGVRRIEVTGAGFDRLLDIVEGSLRDEGRGPVVIPGAAYGDYDRFFEAKGRFTALLGCNTWAAAGLRAAGLRTGWWTPLPQTLGISVDILNGRQSLSAGGVQP